MTRRPHAPIPASLSVWRGQDVPVESAVSGLLRAYRYQPCCCAFEALPERTIRWIAPRSFVTEMSRTVALQDVSILAQKVLAYSGRACFHDKPRAALSLSDTGSQGQRRKSSSNGMRCICQERFHASYSSRVIVFSSEGRRRRCNRELRGGNRAELRAWGILRPVEARVYHIGKVGRIRRGPQ